MVEYAGRHASLFEDIVKGPIRHGLGKADGIFHGVGNERRISGTPLGDPDRQMRHDRGLDLMFNLPNALWNDLFRLVHVVFPEDGTLRIAGVDVRTDKVDGQILRGAVADNLWNPCQLRCRRPSNLKAFVYRLDGKCGLLVKLEVLLLGAGPETDVWLVPDLESPFCDFAQPVAADAVAREGLHHVVPVLPA